MPIQLLINWINSTKGDSAQRESIRNKQQNTFRKHDILLFLYSIQEECNTSKGGEDVKPNNA